MNWSSLLRHNFSIRLVKYLDQNKIAIHKFVNMLLYLNTYKYKYLPHSVSNITIDLNKENGVRR